MSSFVRASFFASFACIVLLIPLIVVAAESATSVDQVAKDPWWHLVLVDVLIGFGTVIIGLIGKALSLLFDWIAEKTKWTFAARVDDMIMDVVTDLYAAEVEHAKNARADGKLTDEEKEMFKTIAWKTAKQWLGEKGLKKLGKLFNGSADNVIKAKIEKAVAVSKNAGKLARGSEIAKALGAASDPQGSSASLR